MKGSVDFKNEEKYLENTLSKIDKRISELVVICRERFERIQELSLNPDPKSPEFLIELPSEKSLYVLNTNELERLKSIVPNPYFGKINYHEILKAKDMTVYIGKKGVNEFKDDEIPVIDWRTPVANIYYSCKFGRTSYFVLEKQIPIDLKQKRTLKIRNSRLESIYDADIVLNDDLLVDYLNQNKNLVLNEIVATIQEEQNEIIRKSFKKSLVVQGVAGSGKTTVAIHRISYLLYSFNKDINSENIILIAANPLFLNYITSMLPDLDVPVIKQYTMADIIKTEFDYAVGAAGITKSESGINYNNDDFIHRFENLIQETEAGLFDISDIVCFGTPLIYEFQIKRILENSTLTISEKADMLDNIIMENLENKKQDILIDILEDRQKHKEEIKEVFGLECDDFYSFDYHENYKMLLKRFRGWFRKKAKKITAKALYIKLSGKRNVNISGINDMACYSAIQYRLNKPNFNEDIRHVVIDEAQDFNISIYMFMRRLYPNATFTVMGDLMQNINADGLDTWDSLKFLFGETCEYIEMLRSYRNTYEISMFTKKVIEGMSHYRLNIAPLKRNGDPVRCIPYGDTEAKQKAVKAVLDELASNNKKLNAIICKTGEESKRLHEYLSDRTIRLDVNFDFLTYGNYVVDIHSAKGLEFDSVIIWDFDDYGEKDIKQLYVALTRALHNLYIFTNRLDA